MKPYKPSRTAVGIAAARARESRKPEGVRICYDPYARYFLWKAYYVLAKIPFLLSFLRRRNRRRLPGIFEALVARTRYIDDYLQSCLDRGLEQFVSLGAGFDARPYRVDGLKSGVRVFEVDHPATQSVKKQKLKNIFGSLPGHVTFVPVRFNSQDLGERLLLQGFDPGLRTLFVWEGVTMYLTPRAVEQTLGFVQNHTGPGSSIIFDVIPASVVNGPKAPQEGRALKRNVKRLGEELRFGIEGHEIENFMTSLGFVDVESINSRECQEIYFTGVNAHRKVSGIFYFVHAAVPG